MERISLEGKTNFFERRVSDYSLVSNTNNKQKETNCENFELTMDF